MAEMDASTAKAILDYDPETGVLRWKHCAKQSSAWNSHHAGKEAGCLTYDGYIKVGIGGISYRAHRLIWLMEHGEWPKAEIDHKNRVRNDNRLDNLRAANRSQNTVNSAARRAATRGVAKEHNKWRARIKVGDRKVHLGMFLTKEEASRAFAEASIQLYGEFAK